MPDPEPRNVRNINVDFGGLSRIFNNEGFFVVVIVALILGALVVLPVATGALDREGEYIQIKNAIKKTGSSIEVYREGEEFKWRVVPNSHAKVTEEVKEGE